MPKHPKKKHGKGFFDDLANTAGSIADHFDLFGTQAAKKKAEEAQKEADRLKNRSGLEKIGDLAWNAASSVLPELGSYLVKEIGNRYGGNKEPLLKKGGQRFMANRAVPNKVPNVVRVREMNDVRNYNRDQQRKVFENEKRQVQSESESIKPIDAKDAGAAFKLQTYLSKVSQILAQKNDLFAQVSATPFTDLDQLKGTTKQAALLTMLASKAEFLQAYNEMVAYVSLFFKDIQQDNRVRDRMYSAYFIPLMDQMKQVAAQYPDTFSKLPAPERGRRGQPATRQGIVYDTVRNELRDMYSLLMLAAQNIQAGIFRPLSAKDVGEYTIENNVSAQFQVNPPPPSAPVPSMAVQQAQQAIAMSNAQQAAAAAQAQELALRDPFNPAGDMTLDPRQGQQFQMIRAWARAWTSTRARATRA